MERLSHLGSDIHVSTCCEPEVNKHLGRASGVMDSLDHGGVALLLPMQEDESLNL